MINSRNIEDLLPVVQAKATAFLDSCRQAGLNVILISTYRDLESQAALYAQGRTAPGHIVTNAEAGHSFHNYRCAFDFLPMLNGKPVWDDHTGLYSQCGKIGKAVGLEWAGDWHSFKEQAHLQYTGGLTLKDLAAGKIPT